MFFFEDPKGGDFRCLRCQGDYFSKWNLRRHAFQRHDLFVPDDGGPWRPPTVSEREDFLLKLDRSAKRKEEVNVLEASSAKHSREESVEQPDLQRQDDVNLTSTFDPNGLLNLEDLSDPLLSGMMRDSGDESESVRIRMVTSVAPPTAQAEAPPALAVCPTSVQSCPTGTVMPINELLSIEPDQMMTPEDMVEMLASDPELDINRYVHFLSQEHKLDEASVEGIKRALEKCRRHLKHYAETLLLDNLQSRISESPDPNKDLVMRLLKQTGRSN